VHHALRVLRLGRGDDIALFDGTGGEYQGTIARAGKRDAWARIDAFDAVDRESALATTLVQAIVAADTMDAIVRHAVELGVAAIQPVVTERSARFPLGAHGDKRLAHWRQVARAGCEQCGRNRVPDVRDPVPLAEWLSHPRAGIVFDARADASLASLPPATAVDVVVGLKAGSPIAKSRMRCTRACTRCASVRASFAPTPPHSRRWLPSTCFGATSDEARHIDRRQRRARRLHDVTAGAFRHGYRYVVLGPEGVPVARVITARAQCPALEVDGASIAMTVRMPAGTIPVRPSRSDLPPPESVRLPRHDLRGDHPGNRGTRECRWRLVAVAEAAPKRVVILGDTGCRIVSNFGIFQSCDDPIAWPFERVANAAAAAQPDLVIHVGDFHYREGPCDLAHPGCYRSPWGYGYDAWRADFFQPARRLLAAAPWIVIRGNHESCNRAGQGWWRFLDPRSVMRDRTATKPRTTTSATTARPTPCRSAAAPTCSSWCSIPRGWA
jgi:RsmE family RNA methyltransferase